MSNGKTRERKTLPSTSWEEEERAVQWPQVYLWSTMWALGLNTKSNSIE